MHHLPHTRPDELGLNRHRLEVVFRTLDDWTRSDPPIAPAVAVMLGRRGKVIAPRFFGKQGPEPDAPLLRDDSLFLVASLTKPVTYLAGMMMVERGLLSLSARVADYIPEFAACGKEDVRVFHLFTHTSGLPDQLPQNLALRQSKAPLEKFVEITCKETPLLFKPGTNVRYQSMGTLIVGEIVARLSGKPLPEFLHEEVFEPLGLRNTALGIDGLELDAITRIRLPADQPPSDSDWNSDYWRQLGAPWGGLITCLEDYSVLCELFLSGGKPGRERILSPASVRAMSTNQLDLLPELPEAVRRAHRWGLGWQCATLHCGLGDLLSPQAFGHLGATGTVAWIDPVLEGFGLIFTTAPRDEDPFRLVKLANALIAAYE